MKEAIVVFLVCLHVYSAVWHVNYNLLKGKQASILKRTKLKLFMKKNFFFEIGRLAMHSRGTSCSNPIVEFNILLDSSRCWHASSSLYDKTKDIRYKPLTDIYKWHRECNLRDWFTKIYMQIILAKSLEKFVACSLQEEVLLYTHTFIYKLRWWRQTTTIKKISNN